MLLTETLHDCKLGHGDHLASYDT